MIVFKDKNRREHDDGEDEKKKKRAEQLTYIVKLGGSLRDIAFSYYERGLVWRRIAEQNNMEKATRLIPKANLVAPADLMGNLLNQKLSRD